MSLAPVWISGGTGLVGGRLAEGLRQDGRELHLVTRRSGLAAPEGTRFHTWDGLHVPPTTLSGCSAAVHLAGEPIFGGLPTAASRDRMWSSRIDSTRSLVEAVSRLPSSERPGTLVCASAVGIYGDRDEERLTETSAPGSGFLADLCQAWEAEAARAAEHGLRVVSLRIGVVLSRHGGALSLLRPLFRAGLGGAVGSGRQWFPWVHLDDVVSAIRSALAEESLSGPVNAVAPETVRNEEFTRALARAVRRPAFVRAPAFALRAALGEISGELLGSRQVIPERLQALGFSWQHPTLESALAAELG